MTKDELQAAHELNDMLIHAVDDLMSRCGSVAELRRARGHYAVIHAMLMENKRAMLILLDEHWRRGEKTKGAVRGPPPQPQS